MPGQNDPQSIKRIGGILNDDKRPLKERFRALFTLKNLGGEEAIECIAQCFSDSSALLKHECAYCLGQMQDLRAVPFLKRILEDTQEDIMVRHEAGRYHLEYTALICSPIIIMHVIINYVNWYR